MHPSLKFERGIDHGSHSIKLYVERIPIYNSIGSRKIYQRNLSEEPQRMHRDFNIGTMTKDQ
jgi:hypothetical protein